MYMAVRQRNVTEEKTAHKGMFEVFIQRIFIGYHTRKWMSEPFIGIVTDCAQINLTDCTQRNVDGIQSTKCNKISH